MKNSKIKRNRSVMSQIPPQAPFLTQESNVSFLYLGFFICKMGMRQLPTSWDCLMNHCLITLKGAYAGKHPTSHVKVLLFCYVKVKTERSSPSSKVHVKATIRVKAGLYFLKCKPRLATQKWREEETKMIYKIQNFKYPFMWQ